MVDLMDKIQKIAEIGKSTREKQKIINVSEVFYIWDIMVAKLDMTELVRIIENLIDDNDLKFIAGQLAKGLQEGIADMEKLMNEYDIPFPARPPAGSNNTTTLDYITDGFIYQMILEAIQSFFPIIASGFMNSTTPKIRKALKNHLYLTIELQELIVEYGKLKGYLNQPPVYRA